MNNKLNDKIMLSWLSPLNNALAILVVLIHTYNAVAYNLQYKLSASTTVLIFEDIVAQDIARIAVPLFFSISGYLFYRNASYSNLKDKLSRRIHSLLIPFLIWNTIYFFVFAIITRIPKVADVLNSVDYVELNAKNIIQGIFFYKYNYIMWFIYQLIIFSVLSPLILFLVNKRVYGYITVVALFVLYSLGFEEIPNLSSHTIIVGLYPNQFCYFLFGALVGKNKLIPSKDCRKTAIVLFVLGQIVWIVNKGVYKEWKSNALYIIFGLLSIYAVFLFLASHKEEFIINEKSKLTLLINNNFIIFACHPFILEAVQKIMYYLLPHNSLGAIIDFIVSSLITILICVVIGEMLKKANLRVFRVLTGGRV